MLFSLYDVQRYRVFVHYINKKFHTYNNSSFFIQFLAFAHCSQLCLLVSADVAAAASVLCYYSVLGLGGEDGGGVVGGYRIFCLF